MKTKHTTRFLLSICLMLVFSITPIQVSSMDIQSPDRPLGADGDGFPDLAIGIPGRDYGTFNAAGMVGVIYGTESQLDEDTGQTFDQASSGISGAPEVNDHFGQALVDGDFNRDGYLDLAIGIPDEAIGTTANAGMVTVLYGSSSGFSGSGSQYCDQTFLGTNIAETGDRFGAALASGDFNRDGYDDLAIGVPGQDLIGVELAGVVDVLYGGSSGLTWNNWDAVGQGVGIAESWEEADNFGSVLAAGDFDGDGYHDLAIGVPGEDLPVGASTISDAGVVQIVYGSADGIAYAGNQLLYQGHDGLQDTPEDQDRFGRSLAVGKFDSDRYDDLAIGAPLEDYFGTDAGIVHIVWGTFSGISTEIDMRLSQDLIPDAANEPGDHFGWALASGDIDGDEKDDLLVGVPGQDVDGFDQAGAVHVLWGPFNRFSTSWSFHEPYADGIQFGYSLASTDFDNNGMNDLVIGVPFYDYSLPSNAGQVIVYYVYEGHAQAQWLYLDSLTGDTMEPAESDNFGISLAVLDEPHTVIKSIYLPLISK